MGKEIKIYMCPNCMGKNVGFKQGIKNLFGVIPLMRCNECGHKARIFPQLVIDKKKFLEKKLENMEKTIKEEVESEKVIGKITRKKNLKKDILDDIPKKKHKKRQNKIKKKGKNKK